MVLSAPKMTDPYHGLFQRVAGLDGSARLIRRQPSPSSVPCPTTGRPLRVATVDSDADAICPSCTSPGRGAFVSFDGDLRMAYACPECRQVVWLHGA